MKLLSAWLLPVAVVAAACDVRVDEHGIQSLRISEGRAEDVWNGIYTLPANGTLEVTGQNGAIEVRRADGPQVEVRAERAARAASDEAARALLQKLQISEEVTDSRVTITTAGDTEGEGTFRPAQVSVDYHIAVPAGLTLTFRTENGGVRLNNVNGRITAKTTNGGITGEDLAGSLTAETVNGGVRVDLASITGDVMLSTTNGGVRLTVPPSAKMNVEASVVNGGIDIDDQFGVRVAEGRNQRLSAAINGGGPRVSATSVNGGIRIRARNTAP